MRFASLIFVLLLNGCAGQSLQCLQAVARSDCASGSPASDAMEEQRKAAQTFSEIDDARCSAYGDRSSQGYAQCRATIELNRSDGSK